MKLDVPYYSQFLDVSDKKWMPRACGMACVKMILDFYNAESPELDVLIVEGYKNGGYGKWGWLHDYFVQIFKRFDLGSKRSEGMNNFEELVNELKNGNPIIISAVKHILGQTKFHMVVLTGVEEDDSGNIVGFYYHDPESTDKETGRNIFVDIETFNNGWRKMAIFAYPKNK